MREVGKVFAGEQGRSRRTSEGKAGWRCDDEATGAGTNGAGRPGIRAISEWSKRHRGLISDVDADVEAIYPAACSPSRLESYQLTPPGKQAEAVHAAAEARAAEEKKKIRAVSSRIVVDLAPRLAAPR